MKEKPIPAVVAEVVPEVVSKVHRLVKTTDSYKHTGFNRWLAIKLTNIVGTMWCAYAFGIIALIGLPSAIHQSQQDGPLPIVQWIAQTFLQLVLLSVIMVGQNVISSAQDGRAEADHETIQILHELTEHTAKLQDVQMDILKSLDHANKTS